VNFRNREQYLFKQNINFLAFLKKFKIFAFFAHLAANAPIMAQKKKNCLRFNLTSEANSEFLYCYQKGKMSAA
jgi:hypothetical protein